ncbi:MAG: T9SS type A sorting domain-containing protein, partial [Ignavibacteria bacterium]
FRLFPNYPNPFNGNTVLTFYCSRPTEGSLKIYDLIGNEIAVLTEGKLAEGNHRINWSPGNLAGGVYFAKFETPEAVKVQKMIYLR